ncbi:MAG: hypothetical protein ACR2IF_15475 [Terriglobales bacterium]
MQLAVQEEVYVMQAWPQRARMLNSWKEVARYLGRGVRTVQRWEIELGLPTHRPKGRERSAVIAFPDELDAWVQSAPFKKEKRKSPVPRGVKRGHPDFEKVWSQCEFLLARRAQLLIMISEALRYQQTQIAALARNKAAVKLRAAKRRSAA